MSIVQCIFAAAVTLMVLSFAAVTPVIAQQAASPSLPLPPRPALPMSGAAMPMKPGGGASDGSMMEMMEKMSKDMAAVPTTGEVDRDFAGMMVPHHRGAIDMAKYELMHGRDPTMRKLAHDVVAAQEREIALMTSWLARHPAPR